MNTHNNTEDLLTKVLCMSEKQLGFFRMLQNDIFGFISGSNYGCIVLNDCLDEVIYDEYLCMRI